MSADSNIVKRHPAVSIPDCRRMACRPTGLIGESFAGIRYASNPV
jgi:hypothetical protein